MTEREANAEPPRDRVPRQGGSPEGGSPEGGRRRHGDGAAPGGGSRRGGAVPGVAPGGAAPRGGSVAGGRSAAGAGSGTSGITGGLGPAGDGLGPDGDGLGPDGDVAGTAEENELRVLLERFVPHLPAPAQRLENVRARLRRRRGRRAAGMATCAVLAVTAAGLLVPGLRTAAGSPDAAGRGAGPASAASAPASATASASAGAGPGSGSAPGSGAATSPQTTGQPTGQPTGPALPGYTLVPFGTGDALRLRVPPGWSTMAPPGSSTVYVSSQDLALPPDNCARPLDGFCTPLARMLAADGVLLAVELRFGHEVTGKYRATRPTVVTEPLLDACRAVGGTKELATVVPEPPGSDAVLTATACLSRPSAPQEERARVLMSTADFS